MTDNFRSGYAALAISVSAVAGLACGSSAADEPAKPGGIAAGLAEWEISFSQRGGPHGIAPVGVRSDGTLLHDGKTVGARRPGPQGETSAPLQTISAGDRDTIFALASFVANSVRFRDPSHRGTYDVNEFKLRLSSGSRFMQISLDPEEMRRQYFGREFAQLCELWNNVKRREALPGRMFEIDDVWQQENPDKQAARRQPQIVPEGLSDWGYVGIRLTSRAEDIRIRIYRPGYWNRQMDVVSLDAVGISTSEERFPTATQEQRQAFLNCARVVINGFELRAPAGNGQDGLRCEVELRMEPRGVSVGFAYSDKLPAEWKSSITTALHSVESVAGRTIAIPSLQP